MALYVTGDTHGEEGRFKYMGSEIMRTLTKDEKYSSHLFLSSRCSDVLQEPRS